ncbi:hypothetical protein Y032_0021g427 [Ancylostoma ceylanicum]|uniref:Reverse transcriptase domain-containing protein n=1 Tax=Ancylostoma ceylanicum TaxID=53326 RepID=A0A016V0L1_9BILA|nr:hypothetical protein Y032_0021g427 [Ancylostoma ceylanicum]
MHIGNSLYQQCHDKKLRVHDELGGSVQLINVPAFIVSGYQMSAEKKSSLPQTQSEKSLLKNENGGEEGKNNSLMVTTLDDALATPNLNPNKINTLGNLARTQQPSPFNPKSQPRSNKPGSKKDDNEEKNAGPEGEPLLEQPSSWNQPSNASSSGQKGDALFPQVVDLLMLCCILTSTYTLWCFPILVLQLGGFYFIIIYLLMLFMIVFPVLHLEIFVGQYCQAGVFKACRSYGLAYEGSALSPLLFILVMDAITRDLQRPAPWTLLYADDVMLASEQKEDYQRQTQAWSERLARFGLWINVKRTEYMTTNLDAFHHSSRW